jgi:hypothetical protein
MQAPNKVTLILSLAEEVYARAYYDENQPVTVTEALTFAAEARINPRKSQTLFTTAAFGISKMEPNVQAQLRSEYDLPTGLITMLDSPPEQWPEPHGAPESPEGLSEEAAAEYRSKFAYRVTLAGNTQMGRLAKTDARKIMTYAEKRDECLEYRRQEAAGVAISEDDLAFVTLMADVQAGTAPNLQTAVAIVEGTALGWRVVNAQIETIEKGAVLTIEDPDTPLDEVGGITATALSNMKAVVDAALAA